MHSHAPVVVFARVQYESANDFVVSLNTKNEFTLVAERGGYIVAFINYYMMWFLDRTLPSHLRPRAQRVAYIATLQAVKPGSHPKLQADHAQHHDGAPYPVSQPHTGLLLALLAIQHAKDNLLVALLCDSTASAVSFYASKLGMLTRPVHRGLPGLCPMHLDLRCFSPFVTITNAGGRAGYQATEPATPAAPASADVAVAAPATSSVGASPTPAHASPVASSTRSPGPATLATTPAPTTAVVPPASSPTLGDSCQAALRPTSLPPPSPRTPAEAHSVTQPPRHRHPQHQHDVAPRAAVAAALTSDAPHSGSGDAPRADETGCELGHKLALLRGKLAAAMARNRMAVDTLMSAVRTSNQAWAARESQRAQDAADMAAFKSMQRALAQERAAAMQKCNEDMEACCCVCGGDDSVHRNLIVICERCELGFHQRCYGVASIPEGEWLCAWCATPGTNPNGQRLCELCPVVSVHPSDNVLLGMHATEEGKFVHVECAQHHLRAGRLTWTSPAATGGGSENKDNDSGNNSEPRKDTTATPSSCAGATATATANGPPHHPALTRVLRGVPELLQSSKETATANACCVCGFGFGSVLPCEHPTGCAAVLHASCAVSAAAAAASLAPDLPRPVRLQQDSSLLSSSTALGTGATTGGAGAANGVGGLASVSGAGVPPTGASSAACGSPSPSAQSSPSPSLPLVTTPAITSVSTPTTSAMTLSARSRRSRGNNRVVLVVDIKCRRHNPAGLKVERERRKARAHNRAQAEALHRKQLAVWARQREGVSKAVHAASRAHAVGPPSPACVDMDIIDLTAGVDADMGTSDAVHSVRKVGSKLKLKKKKRGGRSRKADSAVRQQSTAVEVPMTASEGGGAGSNADEGVNDAQASAAGVDDTLYCVCQQPYTNGAFMVGCDGPCQGWFHPACLGYQLCHEHPPESCLVRGGLGVHVDISKAFVCPSCKPKPRPKSSKPKAADAGPTSGGATAISSRKRDRASSGASAEAVQPNAKRQCAEQRAVGAVSSGPEITAPRSTGGAGSLHAWLKA